MAAPPTTSRERAAERLARLVDEEARAVGRDLDQHSVRHAEVDRAEVGAVLHRRRTETHLGEPLEPPRLPGVVGGAESDMVGENKPLRAVDVALGTLARMWPRMFAFNFLVVAERAEELEDIYDRTAASADL